MVSMAQATAAAPLVQSIAALNKAEADINAAVAANAAINSITVTLADGSQMRFTTPLDAASSAAVLNAVLAQFQGFVTALTAELTAI